MSSLRNDAMKRRGPAARSACALTWTLLAALGAGCGGSRAKTESAPVPPSEPLALTPPMGFNNWNAFGCDVSETLIRETADFLVSSGLAEAGYRYVNIDDCWSLRERGKDGKLVPDPVKFPSGIRGLAEYVHAKGLKLGIYGDAGTKTCAGYPGSLGREELDARTWAEWGVDYVKYDNCYNQSDGSQRDYVKRYTAMSDALAATGRPIVYSMCEWGTSKPWEWAADVAHLWRTTGDISDSWSSLRSIIAQNAPLGRYAGPANWNDPDMLEIGNGGMTPTEYRTHMSMWAIMAAPLIIGTDLRRASKDTLAILGNRELIAIDQDALGAQGAVVSDEAGLMVVVKPLANGERAVALYNSTDAQAVLDVAAADVGLAAAASYRLVDVWSGKATEAKARLSAGVPAHGTALYRARPAAAGEAAPPSVSVGAALPTLIAGMAKGATLSVTVTNRGAHAAAAVAVSVRVPGGWETTSLGAPTADSLATDASFQAKWTVRAPKGLASGRYPIGVTAEYRFQPDSGAAEAVSVTTEAVGVVAAPPLDGATPLSRIIPVSSTNATGPVELDMSNGAATQSDGNLITIGGKVYTRGLGTHAASEIVYYLGGRCSTLTTDVGIDDSASAGGSVAFRIHADDQVAAESGPVTADDAPKTLTATLTDATWLRLVAEPQGVNTGNHADWAAPLLVCGGSTAPTAPEKTLFSFETGIEGWTIANAGTGGTVKASSSFATDGARGVEIVAPTDGNWFGRKLDQPLDLSAFSSFKFDLQTSAAGTSGEIAIQVGAAESWCQGGLWTWTNPNSTKTITGRVSGIECPQGVPRDLTQVRAVWVYLKGGTFQIDNLRAE